MPNILFSLEYNKLRANRYPIHPQYVKNKKAGNKLILLASLFIYINSVSYI